MIKRLVLEKYESVSSSLPHDRDHEGLTRSAIDGIQFTYRVQEIYWFLDLRVTGLPAA
jgi:hypothetical protein